MPATDESIRTPLIVAFVALFGVLVILLVAAGFQWLLERAKRRRDAGRQHQEAVRRAIVEREGEFRRAQDELETARTYFVREQEEFEQEREEEEAKLLRARTSLANAKQMMQRVPRKGDLKALADFLHESYLFDQAIGDYLSVIRIINPDFNGNVEFRWKLHDDMPGAPRVEVRRGGKLVKTDSGIEGEWKEHVTPGKRALFSFVVREGKQQRGGELVLEVKVPKPEVWNRRFKLQDGSEIKNAFKDEVRAALVIDEATTEMMTEVNAKNLSEKDREWQKSVIEGVAAKFRGDV